jgi:hypothetical protein
MSYNPDLPNGGLSPKEQLERLARVRRSLDADRRLREADTSRIRRKWHGMGYSDDDILNLAASSMATYEILHIAEVILNERMPPPQESPIPKQNAEPKEPIFDPSAAVIAGLILIGLVIFTVCLI